MKALSKIYGDNPALVSTFEATKTFIEKSRAKNTTRSYAADIRDFVAWCSDNGLQSIPSEPSTVALYISDLAEQGKKTSTIRRRLSAIKMLNESQGFENPVRDMLVKTDHGRYTAGKGHTA